MAGSRVTHGGQNELVAITHAERHLVRVTDAARLLNDHLEHRAHHGRRGGDHLQDFGSGGLLLQCLGDLTVALFEFLEQPGILDRDHGLISETLQQVDLSFGVRIDLATGHHQDPQHGIVVAQRECRDRSRMVAVSGLGSARRGELVERFEDVGYVDRRAVDCDPAGNTVAARDEAEADRDRPLPLQELGHEHQIVTDAAPDVDLSRAAHTARTLDYGPQDVCEVRRR